MNSASKVRGWRRPLAILAAIYFFLAFVSWLAVPWTVRRALQEVPKKLPGFSAKISEVRFNPFKLALTVRGFAFSHEKLGDIATCDEFYAGLQPLDLLRLAVGLRRLRLTRPRLVAVLAADGTSVLDALPKSAPAPAAPAASASARAAFIPRIVIHHFLIERAALEFESRLRRAPQRLVADPIDFSLDNLSTLPDDGGSYIFSARTNRGETLSWKGRLSVRPAKLSGRISAQNVDLSRETTAAPAAPVTIASGRLDAATDYELGYADGTLTAALSDGRLSVHDMLWNVRGSTAPARGPFSLEVGPSSLSVRTPLPAAPGAKTVLSARTVVASRGTVQLDAVLAANPLGGSARLLVKDFPLAPFTPLGPPPTQVVIDSGAVSLDVKAALAAGAVDATAAFSLDGFSLSDRASRRALVKVGRFSIDGVRASTKSRRASIERVGLERPFLRLFRGKDGRTNVEAALGVNFSSASAAAPTASSAPVRAASRPAAAKPWQAELRRLAMRGARLVAQDEAVAPAFALSVHDVNARLEHLRTDGRSTATFSSDGKIEDAPFSVSGDVRLSSAAAWVDALVKTEAVQLTAFTPYSIQVIGYKLDRGTLSLNLDESLAVRRIESRNKIVVDQLTLGDKVDSPTAIKAPVKLGLAIMKDRRGVIDLDVPISGSLDDPQFRLLPVILKTLVNLIVKAALSPFDALSASMGGADLGHVAFAPGASALAAPAAAGLDKVAQALADRPALSVGARGTAGRADALALGDAALRRRLRGSEPGAADLTPAETKSMLSLYAKTFGAPAASPESARAKLDDSFAAGAADLQALAVARAAAIQSYLLAKGLAPARFFALDPAVGAQKPDAVPCELKLDVR